MNRLSPRHVEILRHVDRGDTTPVIAAQLGVSPHTVKSQLREISWRLGTSGRRQAVEAAKRTGQLT